MKRIGYTLLFLIIAAGSQAQLSVSTSADTVCQGTTIQMTASGADIYQWSSQVAIDTNAGTMVSTTPPVGSHTVQIVGFDTTLNDTDTVVVNIVVRINPTVVIQSSAEADNNFICLGSAATLEAISDTGLLDQVMWSPSTGLSSDSGKIVQASPTTTTTYSVTVTNIYGCQVSGTKIVQVGNQYPVFSVAVSPSEICPGDSSTFTATGVGIVNKYEWSPANLLSQSSGTSVKAGPTTTTQFTATATTFGCKVDTTFTLNVLAPPNLTITKSKNVPIALDETNTITVTCPTCIEYVWKFPNSTLTTSTNVQTVSPNNPGPIEIRITGRDDNSCTSTESVVVDVDSTFIGTPFGLNDLDGAQFSVRQSQRQLNVSATDQIQGVAVYSMLGEQLIDVRNVASTSFETSMQQWSAGMYIVVVKTASDSHSQKIYLQ